MIPIHRLRQNPRPDEEARQMFRTIALRAQGKWDFELEFEPGDLEVARDLILEHGPQIADLRDYMVRAVIRSKGRKLSIQRLIAEATRENLESLVKSGVQTIKLDHEQQERVRVHNQDEGNDWGPDGHKAWLLEKHVRSALKASDPHIAKLIEKFPLDVRSSYTPKVASMQWANPDWRQVLIFTESGIGDPYTHDSTYQAFDRANELLGAGWIWESINPAVHEFRLDVPVDAPFSTPGKRKAKPSRTRRRNPGSLVPNDDTKRAAIGKYKEFWRKEPTQIGDFPSTFTIPARVRKLGKGKHVLYSSLKKDPETLKNPSKPIDYIHDHEAGVHIYACDGTPTCDVPEFISQAQALVKLGDCIGFAFIDDDGEHEAEGTHPLPDLYCTIDGRALLVIQSRRNVLAMIWGGDLGVEARGIVG